MRHGTQEELDAAREDATLLPFDALFKSRYGFTAGANVFRVSNKLDDQFSVMFQDDDCDDDFHAAENLEPIP